MNEYRQAAAQLSRMILGPLAGELKSRRLLVVTDGALAYIPFSLLPQPSVSASAAEPVPHVRHRVWRRAEPSRQ